MATGTRTTKDFSKRIIAVSALSSSTLGLGNLCFQGPYEKLCATYRDCNRLHHICPQVDPSCCPIAPPRFPRLSPRIIPNQLNLHSYKFPNLFLVPPGTTSSVLS
jgi:hypothetical protein